MQEQNMKMNVSFDDKAMAMDLLNSQKALSGDYNTFLSESATGEVKNCLLQILKEEHEIQDEIFGEMSTRGWYPTPKAEDTKINEAKTKFENMSASM